MDELKKHLVLWIIVSLVGVGFFSLVLFTRGNFAVQGYMDACFYPGMILLLVMGLIFVADTGFFDLPSYGLSSIFFHLFNTDQDKVFKYRDLAQYKKEKRDQRQYHRPYFLPFLVVGGLFIIAALVLYIIFRQG